VCRLFLLFRVRRERGRLTDLEKPPIYVYTESPFYVRITRRGNKIGTVLKTFHIYVLSFQQHENVRSVVFETLSLSSSLFSFSLSVLSPNQHAYTHTHTYERQVTIYANAHHSVDRGKLNTVVLFSVVFDLRLPPCVAQCV
jgi:hypothetical protein